MSLTTPLVSVSNVLEADQQFCDALTVAPLVEAPSVVPPATPVAFAPQQLSICTPLTVTGANSFGTAGRALSYYWSISPMPSSPEAQAVIAALNNNATASFTFAAGTLDVGTYSISLRVANFLSTVSAPTTISVTVSSGPVPTLSFDYETPLVVVASDETALVPTVTFAPCATAQTLVSFSWTVSPALPNFVPGTGSSLFVPRNKFSVTVGSYTVTVTASTTVGAETFTSTASHPLIVRPPLLSTRVIGGARRSVGTNSGLSIPFVVVDPAGQANRPATASLTCTNVAPNAPDNLCRFVDVFNPSSYLIWSAQNMNIVLSGSKEPQSFAFSSFQEYSMITSVHYRFHVEVYDTLRDVTTVDAVVIEPYMGATPMLLLDAINFNNTLPSAQLTITSQTIQSNPVIALTYEWASLPGTVQAFGFSDYPLTVVDPTNPANLGSAPGLSTLILKKDVLSASSAYKFRLIARNSAGTIVAFCDIIIRTTMGPTSGSMIVTPNSGAINAFYDQVTIALPNWTADPDQLPLTYAVRLYTDATSFVELSSVAPAFFSSSLPNPVEGGWIRVEGRITQRNGATTVVSQTLTNVRSCLITSVADLLQFSNYIAQRGNELTLLGDDEGLIVLSNNALTCMPTTDNGRRRRRALDPESETQLSALLVEIVNMNAAAMAGQPQSADNLIKSMCVMQTVTAAGPGLPANMSDAFLSQILSNVDSLEEAFQYGSVLPESFMSCLLAAQENALLSRNITSIADLELFWTALDRSTDMFQTAEQCGQLPRSLSTSLIDYTTGRSQIYESLLTYGMFTFPPAFQYTDDSGSPRCMCLDTTTIANTVYNGVPLPQGYNTTASGDSDLYEPGTDPTNGGMSLQSPLIATMRLRDCSRATTLGMADTNSPIPLTDLDGFVVSIAFNFAAGDNFVPTAALCVYLDSATGEWSTEGVRLVAANATHATCTTSHFSEFAILQQITVPVVNPTSTSVPVEGAGLEPWAAALITLAAVFVASGILVGLFVARRNRQKPAAVLTEQVADRRQLDFFTFSTEASGIDAVTPPAYNKSLAAAAGAVAVSRKLPEYAAPPAYTDFMLAKGRKATPPGAPFVAAAAVAAPATFTVEEQEETDSDVDDDEEDEDVSDIESEEDSEDESEIEDESEEEEEEEDEEEDDEEEDEEDEEEEEEESEDEEEESEEDSDESEDDDEDEDDDEEEEEESGSESD